MHAAETMRGLVPDPSLPHRVGLRDNLALPEVREGEILVRVTHTTINGHEFELARRPMVRALASLAGARGEVRTGLEFAGVVTSDGAALRRGDRVMGYVEMLAGAKPHADFVAIPEAFLAAVPASTTMAEASTLPMSGLTALAAVRDVAAVQQGHKVLVVGASGGVGVLTVQLARMFGAEVTAMATLTHREALTRLGAHHVVDPRETPVADIEGRYDVVFDFSDTLRLRDVRHILGPDGAFVPADPVRNAVDIGCCHQARYLMVDRGDSERLSELAAWVDDGALVPVLDRAYAMGEWRQAVERGHARGRLGRTVLAFDDGRPDSCGHSSD